MLVDQVVDMLQLHHYDPIPGHKDDPILHHYTPEPFPLFHSDLLQAESHLSDIHIHSGHLTIIIYVNAIVSINVSVQIILP